MMREHKYKAWDNTEGKWLIVRSLWTCAVKQSLVYPNFSIDENGVQTWVGDQEIILVEYTGLKDKNGKEIYEGDIVTAEYGVGYSSSKYPSFADGTQSVTTEVVFWTDCGYDILRKPHDCNFYNVITVIGNRFENPDLLDQ